MSHERRRKAKEARRADQAANVARKKAANGGAGVEQVDGEDVDLDVDGLSSEEDPEEGLERIRRRKNQPQNDENEGFEYEDAVADGAEQEGELGEGDDENEVWDEDVVLGEVSSADMTSEDEEEPVKKKIAGRPVAGERRKEP